MKMVKKVLMGMAVLAIAVALTGCLKDDKEKAIKGSGNKYTVEYTNEGSEAYRAYAATGMAHAGALVKVTFDSINTGSSKMGIIFDLHDSKSGVKDAKGAAAKDFYAIAIGNEGGGSYYVSKFTDIVDIQAKNFGATTTAKDKEPKEVEYVPLVTGNLKTKMPAKAADGSLSLYICYKCLGEGVYAWGILTLTDEQAAQYDPSTGEFKIDLPESAVVADGDIGMDDPAAALAAIAAAAGNPPQNKIAFYAQVASKATLKGSWNVKGTYKEAEDAE